MTFPPINAPLTERLDAIADLLAGTDIEIDGVPLAALAADLHDAALILRAHRGCPPITRAAVTPSTSRKATLRRHYG